MNSSKIHFYFQYAIRSLRRGGQRTLLAMVCIAFGVMSLIALQTVAELFHAALFPDSSVFIGGDALLSWVGNSPAGANRLNEPAYSPPIALSAPQIEQLDQLKARGVISAYSLQTGRQGALLKLEGSNNITFVQRVLGVDSNFPLAGDLQLQGQTGDPRLALAAALEQPGSVAVTRDLAAQLGLHVGSRLTLALESGQVSPSLQVTAILQAIPDRRGSTVLYSLATAQQISEFSDVAASAAVLYDSGATAERQIRDAGWSMITRADATRGIESQNIFQVFDFMLKAAGVLGLIIGGIGVANTLQVLLARRTLEIAVLKTHGYGQGDLLALFGLETALLGVGGSLLGIAAAFAVTTPLIQLIQSLVSDTGTWNIDSSVIMLSALAGIATTIIFGLNAVVRASAVRPAVLLRSLSEPRGWNTRAFTLGLATLLGLAFLALTTLIMGSVLQGLGVIAAAVAGLLALGGVLELSLYLLLRIPVPLHSLLALARATMRRQLGRSLFPMIALFCGVFTIGFASTAVASAFDRALQRQVAAAGDNVWAYAQPAESSQVHEQMGRQAVQDIHTSARTPAQLHVATSTFNTTVLGSDIAHYDQDIQLANNATWDSSADAAYLPLGFSLAPWKLAPGSPVSLTLPDGRAHTIKVAGFYTLRTVTGLRIQIPLGIVMNNATIQQWNEPTTLIEWAGQLPAESLPATDSTLQAALPQALIYSSADSVAFLNRTYWELVDLVYAVAGLALVAGAVLIANAVSLALVERRQELGILKAVGFTSGNVMQTILLENGLLGLIAGVLGMIAVAMVVPLANARLPGLQMGLHPELVATMIVLAVLFALGSAAAVAWQPTRVRPLEVLRNE